MENKETKRYLGDGVYISFDGYHIWLTTEYGKGVDQKIALEPQVLEAFDKYRERLFNNKK